MSTGETNEYFSNTHQFSRNFASRVFHRLTTRRSISCDDYAYGSLRVRPVCLVTGEAAGIGAAMALRMGWVDVHDIDLLRGRLVGEGQNI